MMKSLPADPRPASKNTADPAALTLDRIRFAGLCLSILGAAVSISIASIGAVVYLAALVLAAARRPSRIGGFPAAAWLAAFSAAVLASVVLNGFPAESRQGLLKYAWGFLMLHAASDLITTRRRWIGIAGAILLCEAAAALSGIGQDFTGRDFIAGRSPVLYTAEVTRITGPFKHCNDFATFLIPGWLFGCAWLVDRLRKRGASAAAAALLLIIIGWAMLRTMSRGAMIGAAAGTVLLALTLPYRKWIFTGMFSLAAAAWWIPSPLASRLHQMEFMAGSMRERLYLIRSTLKMVDASPYLGLGPNTFSRWFPVYNPPDPAAPILMYAHNSFLQMAAEIGWVGLGTFLALLAALLLTAWRRLGPPADASEFRWVRAAALASAAGLLVNALFESLLQSTQLRTLFWIMMGLALTAPLARLRSGSSVK